MVVGDDALAVGAEPMVQPTEAAQRLASMLSAAATYTQGAAWPDEANRVTQRENRRPHRLISGVISMKATVCLAGL